MEATEQTSRLGTIEVIRAATANVDLFGPLISSQNTQASIGPKWRKAMNEKMHQVIKSEKNRSTIRSIKSRTVWHYGYQLTPQARTRTRVGT